MPVPAAYSMASCGMRETFQALELKLDKTDLRSFKIYLQRSARMSRELRALRTEYLARDEACSILSRNNVLNKRIEHVINR